MNPSDTSVHPAISMIEPLLELLGCELVEPESCEAADVPLHFEGRMVGAVRLPALHGALDRLIDTVEREIGCQVIDMNREQKQLAIRLLDERGAFILRRAVEDVADAIGVSRITVYNYLNAIHR
ncbi:MAG: helix-turn-helix domain-containing protein [Actinomycetota bacterium]|nr:helix-turn-helix domain-containing protein [Actinomycetota bacterium]MDA2971879.1 helix-turn-helix domain-containing protein [Actinomycetota bacterium]MDA3001203.1 helix-turn-helix domain-containing protein [Actinomycetota bacterium]